MIIITYTYSFYCLQQFNLQYNQTDIKSVIYILILPHENNRVFDIISYKTSCSGESSINFSWKIWALLDTWHEKIRPLPHLEKSCPTLLRGVRFSSTRIGQGECFLNFKWCFIFSLIHELENRDHGREEFGHVERERAAERWGVKREIFGFTMLYLWDESHQLQVDTSDMTYNF